MKAITISKNGVNKNFKSVTTAARYLKVKVHNLEYVLSNKIIIKGYKVKLFGKKVAKVDYRFEQWAAEAFGVNVKDLIKPHRLHNDVTYARYICYLYLAKHSPLRFRDIGNRYGNRSYSAVSYSLKRSMELLEIRDPQFMLGLEYFNDLLEEHNIISQGGEFKVLEKSWTFTDKEISSMKFMVENGIQSYKIAVHYGLTIYDLRYILDKKQI